MSKQNQDIEQQIMDIVYSAKEHNFNEKIKELVALVMQLKESNMPKDEVSKLIDSAAKRLEQEKGELDMYQDEVYTEVGCRLVGYASPGNRIDW